MSEFEGAQFVVLLCVESGCVDAYKSVWESGTNGEENGREWEKKGVEGCNMEVVCMQCVQCQVSLHAMSSQFACVCMCVCVCVSVCVCEEMVILQCGISLQW